MSSVFSGRNQGYKSNFQSYAEWEKNFPYNMSVSESSESDDSDSDDKKGNPSILYVRETTLELNICIEFELLPLEKFAQIGVYDCVALLCHPHGT